MGNLTVNSWLVVIHSLSCDGIFHQLSKRAFGSCKSCVLESLISFVSARFFKPFPRLRRIAETVCFVFPISEGFVRRFASWAINIQLMIAFFVVFALVGVGLIGLKPFVVMSGSMEPAVHVGALAYVDVRVQAEDLRQGDIVTFQVDDSTTVTHRVVGVDADAKTLSTKGDANALPDAAPVPFGSVVGRLVFSVPVAGMVLDAFVANKTAWIVVLLLLNIALLAAFRALPDKAGD